MRTPRMRFIAALAITLAATSGCDGTNAFAPVPQGIARLVIVSGDGQVAPPGATLARPITVLALDARGDPVTGAIVAASAPGLVSPVLTRTGELGEVEISWTLPSEPGVHRLRVWVPTGDRKHVEVWASATAASP